MAGRRRICWSPRIEQPLLLASRSWLWEACAGHYHRMNPSTTALPQFFDEPAVRARLRMSDLIDAMQRALVEFSAGRVRQPVRTVLEFGTEGGLFGLMP